MQKIFTKPVYYVSFEAIKNRFIYLPWDEKFYHVSIKYDHILIYDPNNAECILKSNKKLINFENRLRNKRGFEFSEIVCSKEEISYRRQRQIDIWETPNRYPKSLLQELIKLKNPYCLNPMVIITINNLKPFKKHLTAYLIQNFLHSKK